MYGIYSIPREGPLVKGVGKFSAPEGGRGDRASGRPAIWSIAGCALPRGPRPYPGRGSRLSLRESPDAKSPREGRVSPLPGPTSLWFEKLGEVGFSFSYKLWTDARNGPPPGWAGWGKWGGKREKGCGFLYPKPSPWGEGGPAQPGRMRGRPGTQRSRRKPAYRRQAVGHWFSTRKGFGVIAPSSVCFADSFPPRGSRCRLQVAHRCSVDTNRLYRG